MVLRYLGYLARVWARNGAAIPGISGQSVGYDSLLVGVLCGGEGAEKLNDQWGAIQIFIYIH